MVGLLVEVEISEGVGERSVCLGRGGTRNVNFTTSVVAVVVADLGLFNAKLSPGRYLQSPRRWG